MTSTQQFPEAYRIRPPDLDCREVFHPENFKVLPFDPHDFDRDEDGIGCDLEDKA